MADQTAPTAPSPVGLHKNAIGLREVLFQSVTDMAPGAAIAASIPAGALLAGGSLPLSVVVALVACLLTASSIAELARHMPTAGSLATYAAQGLHRAIGFLVALVLRSYTPFPASVQTWVAVLGVFLSSGVGLFFGIYPAIRASRLDPVVALRSD